MYVQRLVVGLVIVAAAVLLVFVILLDKNIPTSVGQGAAENPVAFYLLGPGILGFAGLILIITAVVGDYRTDLNRGKR